MARYNIRQGDGSNKAILTDSDGTRDLIAESLVHTGTFTVTNTIASLSPGYFTNYFPDATPIQGSTSGYASGGYNTTVINKFPFSSDTNSSNVGNLTVGRQGAAGQSSTSHGYSSGDDIGTTIDKFPFSISSGTATDVGDLTVGRKHNAGQSSGNHGYTSAGQDTPPASDAGSDIIDKFPFSSDANATDVGDLTQVRKNVAGQSSTVSGYTSGGGAPSRDTVDKFPFSSDANATDVGNLSQARLSGAGQSSDANGYTAGSYISPPWSLVLTIDKFPFSTDGNATDVGDLSATRQDSTGNSSTTHGYTSGGSSPGAIDKFPFSSDANATDVGNLFSSSVSGPSGQQV